MNPLGKFTDSYRFLSVLVRTHGRIMAAVVAVFFTGALFAFVHGDSWKLKTFVSFAGQMSEIARTNPNIFVGIFINNLRAMLMTQVFGIFIIFPAIIVFTNGYVLGLFSDLSLRSTSFFNATGLLPVLFASVIPHAVIELPTFVFSSFMATVLGLKLFFPKKVEPALSRAQFFKLYLLSLLFCIIPLIAAAAYIESFVTPKVVDIVEKNTRPDDAQKKLPSSLVLLPSDITMPGASQARTKAFPAGLQWMVKLWGVYVYDPHVYSLLRQSHAVASRTIDLKLPGGEFVWGNVVEFPSDEQARTYERAYRDGLDSLAKNDEDIKIVKSGDGWEVDDKNLISRGMIGTVGRYIYIVWYDGKDAEFFRDLVSSQRRKLEVQP